MKVVYFWQGLIADTTITERYQSIFDKLRNGEFKSADFDLKKMAGHRIYSVRINDSDRLLFTTIYVNGQPYLFFLEEILNHDYQKSRFLHKPGALTRFLEKEGEVLAQEINADLFAPVDNLTPDMAATLDEQWAHAIPLAFGHQQFIVLNPVQQEALVAPLPAIISGPPGSGKSSTALQVLAGATPELNCLIYLSSSERLVQEMAKNWLAMPESDMFRDNVRFLTYERWLHETHPETQNLPKFGKKEFTTWFSTTHCKHLRAQSKATTQQKRSKKTPDLPSQWKNADAVYQELRIACAYSKKEYDALGKKQSLFPNPKDKAFIYQTYQAWMAELTCQKAIDLSFFVVNPTDTADLLVVDEAQDFSLNQLLCLMALSRRGPNMPLVFCMDTHQCLYDSISSRPFILQQWASAGFAHHQPIELPHSYRLFPAVLPLAEAVLQERLHVLGGVSDAYEFRCLPFAHEHASVLGHAHWLTAPSEATQHTLKMAAQNPDCVIITLPGLKEAAQQYFNTNDRVFTVDELKGLEYPVVIPFHMMDDPAFIKAAQIYQQCDTTRTPTHRANNNNEHRELALPFNNLFTALSRATQQVICIEDDSHQLKPLTEPLKNSLPPLEGELVIECTNSSPSDEQWWQEACKHRERNPNIAHAILKERLKKTDLECQAFFNPPKPDNAPETTSDLAPATLTETLGTPTQQREIRINSPEQLLRNINHFAHLEQDEKIRLLKLVNKDGNNALMLALQKRHVKAVNALLLEIKNLTDDHLKPILTQVNSFNEENALMLAVTHKWWAVEPLYELISKLDLETQSAIFKQINKKESANALIIAAQQQPSVIKLLCAGIQKLNSVTQVTILKQVTSLERKSALFLTAMKNPGAIEPLFDLVSQLENLDDIQSILILSICAHEISFLRYAIIEHPKMVPLIFKKFSSSELRIKLLSYRTANNQNALMIAASQQPELVPYFCKIISTLDRTTQIDLFTCTTKNGYLNAMMISVGTGSSHTNYLFNFITSQFSLDDQIRVLFTSNNPDEHNVFAYAVANSSPLVDHLLTILAKLTPEEQLRIMTQLYGPDQLTILMLALMITPDTAASKKIASFQTLLAFIKTIPPEALAVLLSSVTRVDQMNVLMLAIKIQLPDLVPQLLELIDNLPYPNVRTNIFRQSTQEERVTVLTYAAMQAPDLVPRILESINKLPDRTDRAKILNYVNPLTKTTALLLLPKNNPSKALLEEAIRASALPTTISRNTFFQPAVPPVLHPNNELLEQLTGWTQWQTHTANDGSLSATTHIPNNEICKAVKLRKEQGNCFCLNSKTMEHQTLEITLTNINLAAIEERLASLPQPTEEKSSAPSPL